MKVLYTATAESVITQQDNLFAHVQSGKRDTMMIINTPNCPHSDGILFVTGGSPHQNTRQMNKGEIYDVYLLDGTILPSMRFKKVCEYYLLWEGDVMTLYRELKHIIQVYE